MAGHFHNAMQADLGRPSGDSCDSCGPIWRPLVTHGQGRRSQHRRSGDHLGRAEPHCPRPPVVDVGAAGVGVAFHARFQAGGRKNLLVAAGAFGAVERGKKKLRAVAGHLDHRQDPTFLHGTLTHNHHPTGGEFAKMALNLALSVRANVPKLEKSLVVVCLDQDAQQQLRREGFGTVLLPGPSDVDAVKDPWQNDDLWKFKYRLMASLMTLDISALVLDTDVVLLSDPFIHLGHDADLEVMTDLFFPRSQLLDVSLRPEDHFNTGYVYHGATPGGLRFMTAFLEAFDAKEWNGFKRDWFNQRAFNKLLLEWVLYGDAAWCALRGIPSRTNVGSVTITSMRSCEERPRAARLNIRVLNPAVIAHGMNYFWRRAHLMPGETGGKAVAAVHANGVEPKDYFLRDRGLWYLDDFAERFGEEPLFFTYIHSEGLSLAEDFEELAAALEVAMMLRRRMVLPKTMNCRNCPAYEPYGFAQWHDADALPKKTSKDLQSCKPAGLGLHIRLLLPCKSGHGRMAPVYCRVWCGPPSWLPSLAEASISFATTTARRASFRWGPKPFGALWARGCGRCW
eukprot:symbB.v1.2.020770.t1/scaffold1749.1/size103200/10